MKNWDAPVLSPLLGELVVLEMGLGRRAPAPIERKFIRPRENVRAVIIYAEWNVAHQRNAAIFGMCFNRGPLFVCNPLDVAEEILAILHLLFLFGGLPIEPGMRRFDVLLFRRPFVPRLALAVFFHEDAEECIVIQPCRFG